jgi:hypothetical protein
MIFDLATTLHLSPLQMAQVYFQSNVNILSQAVNEHLHSGAGWTIIQLCFNNLSNAPMSNPAFGISADAKGWIRQVDSHQHLFNQLLRRILMVGEHDARPFIMRPSERSHVTR